GSGGRTGSRPLGSRPRRRRRCRDGLRPASGSWDAKLSAKDSRERTRGSRRSLASAFLASYSEDTSTVLPTDRGSAETCFACRAYHAALSEITFGLLISIDSVRPVFFNDPVHHPKRSCPRNSL